MAGLKYIDNQTWRYENAGTSTDLLVSSYTHNNLPAIISRTGSAFTLDTFGITDKTFDLPSTNEIWIKFDVYSSNAWGWRIGNSSDANGVCNIGTTTTVNTVISYYVNGSHINNFYFIREVATLQTYLLHMKSGISDGIIEAWCDGTKISTYTGNVNNGNQFDNIYLQSDVYTDNYFSNVIISNSEIGLDEIITGFVLYSVDAKRIINNFPWHFDILFAVRCDIHNSVDWSDEYSIVPDVKKFTISLLEGQSEFWIKFDIYLPQVLSTGNKLNAYNFDLCFNDIVIVNLNAQDASNSFTRNYWGISSDFCVFLNGVFYTTHSELFTNGSTYKREDTGKEYLPLGNQTVLIHYICGADGVFEIWFSGIKLSPMIYGDTTANNALSFENIKSFTMRSWGGEDGGWAELPNISNLVVSTNPIDSNYKVTSNKCTDMFIDVSCIIMNESISQPIIWRYENVGEKYGSLNIRDVPFSISHTGYAVLGVLRKIDDTNSTSLWFKFDFSIVDPINYISCNMSLPFGIYFVCADDYLLIFTSFSRDGVRTAQATYIYIVPEDIVLNDRKSDAIYIFVPSVFNVVHTIIIHSSYKFIEMWFDGKQIISGDYSADTESAQLSRELEIKTFPQYIDSGTPYLYDYVNNQNLDIYQYGSNINIDSELHRMCLLSNIILSNIPIGLQENARSLSEVSNALLTLYQFILDVSRIVENNYFSYSAILDVSRIVENNYFSYSAILDVSRIVENNYFSYSAILDVSRILISSLFLFDITLYISNKTTFLFDIKRKIYEIIWRYENVGRADLLAISGNTVSDLPVTKSRTGTAFWQNQRIATFPIPATKELWAKFDVYYSGTNRWRAYDRLDGNDTGIGRYSNTTTLICYINGPTSYDVNPKQALTTATLHTVLLHMISDSTNGLVEAWLDGVKCYSDDFESDSVIYKGNVESGAYFENFYIQSEDKSNLFSNVIISNAPIDLNDNVRELFNQHIECIVDVNLVIMNENFTEEIEVFDVEYIIVIFHSFSFDIKRTVLIPCSFSFDVARISGGRFLKFYDVQRVINVSFDIKRIVLIPCSFSFDIKRIVLIPCSFSFDVKRIVLIPCSFSFDIGVLIINLISSNVDIKRILFNDNFFNTVAYFDVYVQIDRLLILYLDIRRQLQNETILSLLKAYLPFDNSPTEDLCGNTWTAVENPVVQDSKLVLDGSSYIRTTEFTLGGRDFTICGWCYTDVNCATGARVFSIHLTPDTGNVLVQLRHPYDTVGWRLVTNTNANVNSTSMNIQDSGVIPFGYLHHFEVVYCYTAKTMTFFVDGIQKAQYKNCPQFISQAFVVDLGIQLYASDDVYPFTGTVDNFAIYDGIALHTSNFDVIEYTHLGIALSDHSPLIINFDVSRYINIGFVSSYFDLFRTIFRGIISYVVDVKRRIKWRYENAGNADDLIIASTILTDLPETQSKTGTAFYQTTRAKCFDIPATDEIWLKFDVYFDGENRWRAYNGGSAGTTGVTAQTSGQLGFFVNDGNVRHVDDICKTYQLQTVLLHMKSGASAGVVEAWVDGTKIYTYTGDVNHGENFADIYLQSDGAGTFFSNVIISNSEIKLGEGYCKKTFDTVRFVETREHIVSILSSMKVWLPFDNSPTEDLCGNTWTAYGSATLDTLDGVSCVHLPIAAYLQADNIVDLSVEKFTFDCWCYRVSSSGDDGFFGIGDGGSGHRGIIVSNDGIYVDIASGSGWQAKNTSLLFPSTINVWKHLAIVKDGVSLKFFEDGIIVWTATINNTPRSTSRLTLGGNSYGYGNNLYFAEVRFYEGVALWTENFVLLPNEYYKLLQKYKIVIGDVHRIVLQSVVEFYDVNRIITFMYDVSCVICLSCSFILDVRRYVYSMYLISALKVWLPFDNSVTEDKCGNTWTAYGTPTISTTNAINGKALQLNGSSYLAMTGGITLGGQDFTIRCFFYTGSTGKWARIYSLHNDSNSNNTINLMRKETGNTFACQLVGITTSYFSISLNARHHFELDYSHDDSLARVFVDGELIATCTATISTTNFANVFVGKGNFSVDALLTGSIDEFQIYNGVALHTVNFTPPTAVDYTQLALELDGQIPLTLQVDVERQVQNTIPVQFDVDVERVVWNKWWYYNAGTAELLSVSGTTLNVDDSVSVTGQALWGGTTTSDAFNTPAGVKEVWLKFDLYIASNFAQGNRFSFGHRSAALGGYVGVWNGSGSSDYYKFLVDAKPSTANNSGLTVSKGTKHNVLLHMVSNATNGRIELTVNGQTYTKTGNVNNGADFDCLYVYSSSERALYSNIVVSNTPITQYDGWQKLTFDTLISLYNSITVYYDLIRTINNSDVFYVEYYDIKLNLIVSLQIYYDVFVLLSNVSISYYDINVNVLLGIELYYDVVCCISNQCIYHFDIIRNVIVSIILPDSGNIKYTLSRLRIYSEPQKFILPETSEFYIYGDLVGKVNIYSDTNVNGVVNGSYYFKQHSLKVDFEESNVFYISLNAQVMSPQDIIKLFIHKLNTSNLVGELSLNRAITYVTDGKYVSWNGFINHFLTCLNSVGYNRFLDFYCDIILNNDDTGAITGWDAGGLVVKTADSIVTESIPVDQWIVPKPGSSVIVDKLRVHFPETGYNGSLTNNEKHILAGLNSEWIYRSLELVQYSLGIFFNELDPLYDMYVEFSYNSSSGETANVSYENQNGVRSLVLTINMYCYNNINVTDVNGKVQYNDIYLDRTISHELAHALMALKNDNYGYLPEYVIEGLSELIHGIDDDRYDNIISLLTTRKNDLVSALVDENYAYESDKYAVGYILLRFLAKQGQHIKTNSTYDRLIINNLIITNNLSLVITIVYYDIECMLFYSIYLALDINIVLNNYVDIIYDVIISDYISFIFNCDVVRNIVVTFAFYMIVSVCRIIKQYQLIIIDILRKIKENYNNCVIFNVAMYGVKNSHINSIVFNTVLYGVTCDINDIVPTFNVDSSKTRTKIHQFIKPIIMLLIKPIDNDMIIDHVSSLALRSTPLYPDRSNKGHNVRG